MKKSVIALLALGFAFSGALSCASKAVWNTSDNSVNTTQYRTYQWITPAIARDMKLSDPKLDYVIMNWINVVRRPDISAKVEEVVSADLDEKGYGRAKDGKPDFYITFYAKQKDDDWLSSWAGNTPGIIAPVVIFPYYSRAQSQENLDHVVYLTVYDGKSLKPVWTGRANTKLFGDSFGEKEMVAASDRLITDFKS